MALASKTPGLGLDHVVLEHIPEQNMTTCTATVATNKDVALIHHPAANKDTRLHVHYFTIKTITQALGIQITAAVSMSRYDRNLIGMQPHKTPGQDSTRHALI